MIRAITIPARSLLSPYTHIGIESKLFEDPENPDRPVALNLNLTFPLKTPPGTGILGFATGEREEKPSIIMNTIIRSDGDSLPKKSAEYERWLNEAHAVAVDKWFFTLCRGRLMTTFEDSHGNARP